MEQTDRTRAWIELSWDALENNVRFLRSRLPPGCEMMAVVKANAYGHGALPVSLALQSMGVKAFCAASVPEGAALRAGGVKGEILVLGRTHESQAETALRNGLILTAADTEHARLLDETGLPLRVHLAVDTGMGRLGFPAEDREAPAAVRLLKHLRIEGAYTHLCTENEAFTLRQGERFQAAVAELRRQGCPVEKVHLLSSASLLRFPRLGGDYARLGLALYGCGAPELRPVLSLKARVALVRRLKKGEGAGYGLRFQARRETLLAVLTIGYADGLPRALSCGRGRVLLRGQAAPIAGLICMDLCLADVTEIPGVRPGDEAVLIGLSGEREITAADLAQGAGTVPNEILSRLGPRLSRPQALLPETMGERTRKIENFLL